MTAADRSGTPSSAHVLHEPDVWHEQHHHRSHRSHHVTSITIGHLLVDAAAAHICPQRGDHRRWPPATGNVHGSGGNIFGSGSGKREYAPAPAAPATAAADSGQWRRKRKHCRHGHEPLWQRCGKCQFDVLPNSWPAWIAALLLLLVDSIPVVKATFSSFALLRHRLMSKTLKASICKVDFEARIFGNSAGASEREWWQNGWR